MQPFPHHYSVVAKTETQGDVALEGERLPAIASAPPTEFGGPVVTNSLKVQPHLEAIVEIEET